MNKISEIIANKKRKTITEESIYETYKREICSRCNNRKNNKDLCRITVTQDKEARCANYDKCMKNQCKTCKENFKCNDDITKNM